MFGALRDRASRAVSAIAELAKRGYAAARTTFVEKTNPTPPGPDNGAVAARRARERQRFLVWRRRSRAWFANHMGNAFDAPAVTVDGYFWKQDLAGPAWRLYRTRPGG